MCDVYIYIYTNYVCARVYVINILLYCYIVILDNIRYMYKINDNDTIKTMSIVNWTNKNKNRNDKKITKKKNY